LAFTGKLTSGTKIAAKTLILRSFMNMS